MNLGYLLIAKQFLIELIDDLDFLGFSAQDQRTIAKYLHIEP